MATGDLQKIAKTLRKHIVEMIGKAGSGHPGGSLSAVDLMTALYFNHHLHFDPKNPHDPQRDYFVLSKGHVCPVLYAVIAELGGIDCEELCTLRQPGSRLQGHPAMDKCLPGIEVSSGSLGYGLSIGSGIALGLKTEKKSNKVYVLMGDGEQQEGSIWEAVMAAAHLKLDNLCGIVDCNSLQIDGTVREIMNVEPLKDKYAAFGWNVCEINGHDFDAINRAYEQFKTTTGKPTAILARTIKGKGVSFMENNVEWHGKAPSPEQVASALKELE
ncbi:MAG: transketolase [Endomicrobiales bacterium]|jgi:transketolase